MQRVIRLCKESGSRERDEQRSIKIGSSFISFHPNFSIKRLVVRRRINYSNSILISDRMTHLDKVEDEQIDFNVRCRIKWERDCNLIIINYRMKVDKMLLVDWNPSRLFCGVINQGRIDCLINEQSN